MAVQKVNYDIKVFDNFIEIIPKDGMKDNSIYEIKLNGIKGVKGQYIGNQTVKFAT